MSDDIVGRGILSRRCSTCPAHPSPPSQASLVLVCNGCGLTRARSNCPHSTRSKSLCRVLHAVPCASCARYGSQAYRRRSVQFKARVRSFGKPMPTRSKSLRKCAEHNVSSSTPAPVRVKALYAHHQSHTTIGGHSCARYPASSQRMPGCVSSRPGSSLRPPLRMPPSGLAVHPQLLSSACITVSGPME